MMLESFLSSIHKSVSIVVLAFQLVLLRPSTLMRIEFLAINERLAKTSPIIFAAKDPHPQAEEYREVTGKRSFLIEP